MIGGIKKMVFKNKKDCFVLLLYDIVVNLYEGVNFFVIYNINLVEDLYIFLNKIKEYEIVGDFMVYKMIMELNDVFIILIECEDMLEFINCLDDVMDVFDEIVFLLEIC